MALSKYLRGEDDRQLLQKRMAKEGRLPPGQSATVKWPVLHTGDVPRFDPKTWDFRAGGLVESSLELSWEAFLALPRIEVVSDFHCVTKWSTFDNRWEGVPFREILRRVRPRPEATHVMVLGHLGPARYGYTTNVPLADLDRDDVLFASRHNGRDLEPEHGGPLRLVVPRRYAWKSAKWLEGLEWVEHDRLGFWEKNGYNNAADPWKEERYW